MNKGTPSPGPLAVNGALVWRPFVGGRELDCLAGESYPADGQFSEKWMLSTGRANNPGRDEPDAGLCFLAGIPDRNGVRYTL